MLKLEIIRTFGEITLVGQPLTGYRHFGVPVGGPFDACSIQPLAEFGMAIEIRWGGFEFCVNGDCLAVCSGADVVKNWSGAFLSPGRTYTVQLSDAGFTAYLAVVGRLNELQRKLVAGDTIEIHDRKLTMPEIVTFKPELSTELEFIPLVGYEKPTGTWEVTMECMRMGVQLSQEHAEPGQDGLPSVPTQVGSVQRTGSGRLIIVGPDGPVTGGYEQIGCLTQRAVSRVAQLRPGQQVTFVQPAKA